MEDRTAIVQAVMASDGNINILTLGEAPAKLTALQALVEKLADQLEIDGEPADFVEVLQLINNGHEAHRITGGKEWQA